MMVDPSIPCRSLFVYGTLMAPSVIETVIGRVPAGCRARLAGFVRHPVHGRVYPGMIPSTSPSSTTTGFLYKDLTDLEMKRLDYFEDVEYTRRNVNVVLLENAEEQSASMLSTETYVWTNPVVELDTTRDWSYDDFCKNELDNYLRRTVQPCREDLDRL